MSLIEQISRRQFDLLDPFSPFSSKIIFFKKVSSQCIFTLRQNMILLQFQKIQNKINKQYMLNKNKEQVYPRWQKKQTTINSQNDRFTIYAQMDQSKFVGENNGMHIFSQKYKYKQRQSYQREKQKYSQHTKSQETPVNHMQISKMKETLKNLQNNIYTTAINVNSLNLSNQFQLSRHGQHSRALYQQNIDFHEIEQYLMGQQRERDNEKEKQTERNIKGEKLHMGTSDIIQKMNYNSKLELMKRRLEIISKKQSEPATSKSSFNYVLQLVSPPMSHQNTTRNKSYTTYALSHNNYIKEQIMPSGTYKTLKNTMNGTNTANNQKPKSKLAKQQCPTSLSSAITQQYSDDEIQLCRQKNTVPMPAIIHEDDQQLQQNRRSFTLQIQMNNPKCLSTSLPVSTMNSSNIVGNTMKTHDMKLDTRYSKLEREDKQKYSKPGEQQSYKSRSESKKSSNRVQNNQNPLTRNKTFQKNTTQKSTITGNQNPNTNLDKIVNNNNTSRVFTISSKKQLSTMNRQKQQSKYFDLYPHFSEELVKKGYQYDQYKPNFNEHGSNNNDDDYNNDNRYDNNRNNRYRKGQSLQTHSMSQSLIKKNGNKLISSNQSSQSTKRRDSSGNVHVPTTKKNTGSNRSYQQNGNSSGMKNCGLNKCRSKSKIINNYNNINNMMNNSNKGAIYNNQVQSKEIMVSVPPSNTTTKNNSLIQTRYNKQQSNCNKYSNARKYQQIQATLLNNVNLYANSYSYSYNNKNTNINNSGNSKQSQQRKNSGEKRSHQCNSRSKRISGTSNTNNFTSNQSVNNNTQQIAAQMLQQNVYSTVKTHRSPITQLIINSYHFPKSQRHQLNIVGHQNLSNSSQPNSSQLQLCDMCTNRSSMVSIFSVSLDYTLKYMVIDIDTAQIVKKTDIYSHRGGIQDMMKVDDMIYTIGRDLYLKCACLNENNEEGINISNQKMYKLSSTPTQFCFLSQNTILICCKTQLIFFDTKLNNPIHTTPISYPSYQLLQNGQNIYIGTKNSVLLVGHQSSHMLTQLIIGLSDVRKWMIHPFWQICAFEMEEGCLGILDLRSIRQGRNVIEKNLRNKVSIGHGKKVVDFCWTDNWHNNQGLTHNTLVILTQQYSQMDDKKVVINRLLELNINSITLAIQAIKQININITNYQNNIYLTSSISNSISILRYHEGVYYLGDSSGNLYFISLTSNKSCRLTNSTRVNGCTCISGNCLKNFKEGNWYQHKIKC